MDAVSTQPTSVEPSGSASEGSEYWAALEPLDDRERRFVLAAIDGKEWQECAKVAGWLSEVQIVRVLARPRVRQAIESIAPLLAAIEPKRATRMLRPYVMVKLASTAFTASDAQSTQAIKEILAVDGIAAKGDRAAASLMDILASVERRISARTVDAEVVKVPELPASAGDSESRQAIGIATIPSDADAASGAGSGDASGAVVRRGRRRGRKPRP